MSLTAEKGSPTPDESPDLPDGAEVEILAIDDDLDDEDRARLHAELDVADDELRAGRGIPGAPFLAALRRGDV